MSPVEIDISQIKGAIQLNNYTQAEFAKKLRISRQQLNYLLQNPVVITIKRLQEICKILNIKIVID